MPDTPKTLREKVAALPAHAQDEARSVLADVGILDALIDAQGRVVYTTENVKASGIILHLKRKEDN